MTIGFYVKARLSWKMLGDGDAYSDTVQYWVGSHTVRYTQYSTEPPVEAERRGRLKVT